MRPCWDDYYMALAVMASLRSPDTKTKVGCVIVGEDNRIISTGYNGTPAGYADHFIDWHEVVEEGGVKEKEKYVVHAEMNALLYSRGLSLKGARVFITKIPCNDCLKSLAATHIGSIAVLTACKEGDLTASDVARIGKFGIRAFGISREAVAKTIQQGLLLTAEDKKHFDSGHF